MTDSFVRNLLDFDGLAAAEQLTGESYKDEDTPKNELGLNKTAAIGFGLIQGRAALLEKVMTNRHDTFMGMSWDYFLEVIRDYGFVIVQEATFPYTGFKKVSYPTNLVAAHREKSLLLHATSFPCGDNKWNVNGGSCYGVVLPMIDIEREDFWRAFSHCSNGGISRTDDRRFFWKDIREGLLFTLDSLAEVGSFQPWDGYEMHCNLMDYSADSKVDFKEYGAKCDSVWDAFIATAPDWVKDFIF